MSKPITAKDVAELRARTGAGMMDCKKALEEAGGDMDAAVDVLRKKGIAKAAKRADRAASEGQIVALVAPDGTVGALIEVNSETDFVGRNEEFVRLARDLAEHVLHDTATDGVVHQVGDALLSQAWRHGADRTVGEVVAAASAKTGEKVEIRRVARFANGTLGFYLHHNGKVGALVEVTGGTGPQVQQLAHTIAEHVAAGVPVPPVAVHKDQVPAELVAKERDIFTEQALASGKPEAVVQKMVDGRIAKFFGEVALLEQPWVRDDKQTIGQLVAAAGPGLTVTRFARFQMGEA